MTQVEWDILHRFKALLKERAVAVDRIVAYGSRVRGDAEEFSDFDVLVVVPERDAGVRRTISDCAWEAGFDAGIVLAPVVMTRFDTEESPESASPYLQNVRREGVEV